jgi:hypothetical protein
LRDARERIAVQAEAVATVEARTAGIREDIVRELRQRVERTYVALTTELAEHFAALAPVNARLLELRREHGGRPTGADLASAVWWDELGMGENRNQTPSKMAVWLAHARARGITK